MGKIQFYEMRSEELATMYDSNFTKKDAIKAGKTLVENVIKSGNTSKEQLMTNIIRLKAVIDTVESELRNVLNHEKLELNGVTFTPVDGGNTVNYFEDEIWSEHKRDLEARQEQLKLAQKQDTFDAYGNQVPKVGVTPRKSSLTMKF
jgi:hypothetical protein